MHMHMFVPLELKPGIVELYLTPAFPWMQQRVWYSGTLHCPSANLKVTSKGQSEGQSEGQSKG
jgi:hypothetical protein